LEEVLERVGHVPLPPYIHRPDTPADRERYQSVFARENGSVAAPTASLHFTPEILAALHCPRVEVTLHVGLGTFEPLRSPDVEQNELHAESYQIGPSVWEKIQSARRVIAVGTTATRTIESVARTGRLSGDTNLFLYPGSDFLITGGMLTNFHLPQSSLLLLVCAFAGTDLMLRAYEHAVRQRYRFFSYGDCMLIL
jgi:S-adenosylmethionine:tRNA ribosyltransferase-isomerase